LPFNSYLCSGPRGRQAAVPLSIRAATTATQRIREIAIPSIVYDGAAGNNVNLCVLGVPCG
jgi:hypothetical protein